MYLGFLEIDEKCSFILKSNYYFHLIVTFVTEETSPRKDYRLHTLAQVLKIM